MNSPSSSTSKIRQEITIRLLREEDLPVARPDPATCVRRVSRFARTNEVHGDADYARTRWLADPSACSWRGIVRRTGGHEFRHAVGKRRIIRTAHHSARSVGPRHRPAIASPHDGSIRCVGDSPRGPFHVCVQHEAREPLSKIRFLAAVSHFRHGHTSGNRAIGGFHANVAV